MSNLALHVPIEDILIPPSTYLHDRRISDDIFAPYASGRRAFAAPQPLPSSKAGKTRFPRVLRETTAFLLMEQNITSEGLFRVPPHSKLKEVLKEAYDRGQKYIIWKDNGATLPVPAYPRSEHQDEILTEIDPKDAYSVFMAASLIKAWYADLRQPLFPPASYRDLKRLYGDPEEPPSLERLTDLISPSSEWSFLPSISREILVRHFLPLLATVSARQDQNSMNAENLAVCFAPALLCGPDQLEDAKMSSIIRRTMTEAIELWDRGLREACGVDARAFEEELRLPADRSDWDDPVEGRRSRQDADTIDEHQITGIILQDNEPAPQQPPPLPPRSSNSQPRLASGPSSNEGITKRKPAPPLQVPPRYSTIITDDPHNVADSPSTYAAVTDGFAPPRPDEWDAPTVPQTFPSDEKKIGTNNVNLTGDNPVPPQLIIPKRKALTAEQIDNASSAVAEVQERKLSESRMALPGLANRKATDPVRRKAVPSVREAEDTINPAPPIYTKTETRSPSSVASSSFEPQANEFRRPSWPASANRTPNITSLARPVYPPTNPVTNRPASKSTSLPVPGPKPRTPSPGLLSRMPPSFDSSKKPATLERTITPRRLNMKKASVDDLRRLYEERVETAKTLIQASKR